MAGTAADFLGHSRVKSGQSLSRNRLFVGRGKRKSRRTSISGVSISQHCPGWRLDPTWGPWPSSEPSTGPGTPSTPCSIGRRRAPGGLPGRGGGGRRRIQPAAALDELRSEETQGAARSNRDDASFAEPSAVHAVPSGWPCGQASKVPGQAAPPRPGVPVRRALAWNQPRLIPAL